MGVLKFYGAKDCKFYRSVRNKYIPTSSHNKQPRARVYTACNNSCYRAITLQWYINHAVFVMLGSCGALFHPPNQLSLAHQHPPTRKPAQRHCKNSTIHSASSSSRLASSSSFFRSRMDYSVICRTSGIHYSVTNSASRGHLQVRASSSAPNSI